MKKIFRLSIFLLTVLMIFSFAACSDGDDGSSSTDLDFAVTYEGSISNSDTTAYITVIVDSSSYTTQMWWTDSTKSGDPDLTVTGTYTISGNAIFCKGDDHTMTGVTTDGGSTWSITINASGAGFSGTITKKSTASNDTSDSDASCTVANFATVLASLKSASSEDCPIVKISVTDCTENNILQIYTALKTYETRDADGYGTPTILVDLDLTKSTSLTTIPQQAFCGGKGSEYVWTLGSFALYKLELPETVVTIENHAFWSCFYLKSISIPSSLKYIWVWAFSNCWGLEEITLPADISYIGDAAFSWSNVKISFDADFDTANKYCYLINDDGALLSVKSYTYSSTTASYEPLAYRLIAWNSLSGDITIPDDIVEVGSDALGGNSGITSITVPSSVEYFANQNLSNCTNLKSVTFNAAEGYSWIYEGDSSRDLSDSEANASYFTDFNTFDYGYKQQVSDTLYIALGGENTLSLSKVTIDDTEQTITNSTISPSSWYAISEFETVKIKKGSTVSFTFTQPTQGSNAWNSWALALYDNETVSSANGQFVRGDNWLNLSTDAGFKSGLWTTGYSSANGAWSNDYTYLTCASQVPTTATIVVTVSYDGTNVEITETVDGVLAYTTSSENW